MAAKDEKEEGKGQKGAGGEKMKLRREKRVGVAGGKEQEEKKEAENSWRR